MRTRLLLVLPLGLLLAAGSPEDSKKDLKKLQGTWTIVAVEEKGKKEDKGVGTTAVFSGNKVTFTVGDEKDVTDFRVDAKKKPRWFDITGGAYKSVGIYELEGDMLKVCLNQSGKERPTAFKTEPDSPNERLFILKRGKP